MDIITAIASVAQASPQTVVGDSVATSETPSFASALEQAETANTAPALAAKIAAPPPVALETSVAAAPASVDLPVEPEPEEVPAPAIQAVVEVALPEVEPEAAPAAVTEDLATALDAPADDAVSNDEDTRQSRDSLDAIRQRLELIDTAGQMNAGILAITPPVAWTPPPPTTAEPTLDPVEPDEGYPTVALEWSAPEEDSLAVETRPTLERRLLPVSTAESQAESTPTTQPTAVTTDNEPSLPTAIATLTPTITAVGASPLSAKTATATTPALGSDAWQADLGQQVFAMVRRGEQQMDMQLNPADLGPLSISLNVGEGGIQAQFQSAHASVRAAVEQALPQLQVALATQGLTLGEASVNDGASRQAMGDQPRRESPGGSGETGSGRAQETAEVLVPQQVAHSGAGVDLYL